MRIVKNEEVATNAAQNIKDVEERRSINIDSDDEQVVEAKFERRAGILPQKTVANETLQSMCEKKLKETVKERAELAFMDIPYKFHSQEDLSIALDQCKNLFLDLRYVSKEIVKCFPPDFNVFEIYRQIYVSQILSRVTADISDLVSREPTVVLQLNNFVKTINEAMEELSFTEDQKSDLQQLYMWNQY
jgi:hypothetical protein